MKRNIQKHGFTLMESVIAIAVVAVMLTTFLAVFGPASQGIRIALSVQEADRLTSTLERELQTLRESDPDSYSTPFEKAYDWIRNCGNSQDAILLYNYRGDPSSIRGDGTMEAYTDAGGVAGKDFILQSAVRRKSDSALNDDLSATEGQVYLVHMTQLVFDDDGKLIVGEAGKIADPHGGGGGDIGDPDNYPEAVVAVSASFYSLPANNEAYVSGLQLEPGDDGRPTNLGAPLFTRNLGVRR